MDKIRVAIAGVGNCSSSLVQGIEYYKSINDKSGFVSGIIHNTIGGYAIDDIVIVAAFDIDSNKVGKDLSESIFISPNCAYKFCEVPFLDIIVQRGPLLVGLGENLKKIIPIDEKTPPVSVKEVLQKNNADILINFLPAGSKKATEFYAHQAILANCGFINGNPEEIAILKKWRDDFTKAGLPLAGDDVKSQFGATILHQSLIDLCLKSGCKINMTDQENIGGNTDFFNLVEPLRRDNKISCKKEAIENISPYPFKVDVAIKLKEGFPNDTLSDDKFTIIQLKGENFGSRPLSIVLKLHVEDSPNSAGVMVDIIRAMKIALNRGDSGAIDPICSYLFKRPPMVCSVDDAYRNFILYIKKDQ